MIGCNFTIMSVTSSIQAFNNMWPGKPEKQIHRNLYMGIFLWPENLKNKYTEISLYGNCSKISNTRVSDKMAYANSADPD